VVSASHTTNFLEGPHFKWRGPHADVLTSRHSRTSSIHTTRPDPLTDHSWELLDPVWPLCRRTMELADDLQQIRPTSPNLAPDTTESNVVPLNIGLATAYHPAQTRQGSRGDARERETCPIDVCPSVWKLFYKRQSARDTMCDSALSESAHPRRR